MMLGSTDTTIGHNSQISFYEYPTHKPFINSSFQPLRPSNALSRTVALPESNRDKLLTALQSLSLKIKLLETERERAESSLREITSHVHRPKTLSDNSQDKQNRLAPTYNDSQPRKSPYKSGCKDRRSSEDNHSFDKVATNAEGRHFHLDTNTVPFILGASTTPSHNVTSNVQNVMALLKKHNHQLCLTSKEYAELLNSNLKSDISPHTLLYLDHYNNSPSRRPSSASPVRSTRRPVTATRGRPYSASHRLSTGNITDKQCYSRMKHLRQEFAQLSREHTRLNDSQTNQRELDIISKRMEIILDELELLQKQIRISLKKSSAKNQTKMEINETPLETLRKTRLLQLILKDSNSKYQYRRRSCRNKTDFND